MRCARAYGAGYVLPAKTCLEPKGRAEGNFILESVSLATSVAYVLFVFFF